MKIYFVEHKYKLLNINMQVVEFCNISLTIFLTIEGTMHCKGVISRIAVACQIDWEDVKNKQNKRKFTNFSI